MKFQDFSILKAKKGTLKIQGSADKDGITT
jgi:hypothetical protein